MGVMDLGKKIVKPVPKPPEWKPHPTDKRFEVNSKGQLRTNPAIPLPPSKVDLDFGFIWHP